MPDPNGDLLLRAFRDHAPDTIRARPSVDDLQQRSHRRHRANRILVSVGVGLAALVVVVGVIVGLGRGNSTTTRIGTQPTPPAPVSTVPVPSSSTTLTGRGPRTTLAAPGPPAEDLIGALGGIVSTPPTVQPCRRPSGTLTSSSKCPGTPVVIGTVRVGSSTVVLTSETQLLECGPADGGEKSMSYPELVAAATHGKHRMVHVWFTHPDDGTYQGPAKTASRLFLGNCG